MWSVTERKRGLGQATTYEITGPDVPDDGLFFEQSLVERIVRDHNNVPKLLAVLKSIAAHDDREERCRVIHAHYSSCIGEIQEIARLAIAQAEKTNA